MLPATAAAGLRVPRQQRVLCVPRRQPQAIQAKLLKADLHGAIISGNRPGSSWPSLPGHLSGSGAVSHG